MDATTVGRRLRRLEQSLGRTLFELHPGGQRLTAAGLELLDHVGAIEEGFEALEADSDDDAAAGTIRVSAAEGFGTWVIATRLHEFARRHPRLSIDLVANSGFLSPSKREADVAVTLTRPRQGAVVARKLCDYALGLYGRNDYLATHGSVASRSDLCGRDLVGYVPDLLYAAELNYLDEIVPGMRPRLKSTSINAQTAMIAAGAGMGLLPCFIADDNPHLTRVLPEVVIQRSFWTVYHQVSRPARRIRAFIDWLTEAVEQDRHRLMGLIRQA